MIHNIGFAFSGLTRSLMGRGVKVLTDKDMEWPFPTGKKDDKPIPIPPEEIPEPVEKKEEE